MPFLEAVATWDESAQTATVFAVNRHQSEEMELDVVLGRLEEYSLREHIVLAYADPKATNTAQNPHNVSPRANGCSQKSVEGLQAKLEPLSWNVLRLEKRA